MNLGGGRRNAFKGVHTGDAVLAWGGGASLSIQADGLLGRFLSSPDSSLESASGPWLEAVLLEFLLVTENWS